MEAIRVIGYARLSKASEGHGIDAQRRAIEAHCQRDGLELVGIEIDDGVTGRSVNKRPGLRRAIESCSSCECSAIVSTRVDRLARSSLDFHRIIEQAQRAGFKLLFTEQTLTLDSPEGKLLVSILAGFAAFEADLVAARTKAGLEVARSKGRRLGRPPVLDHSLRARIIQMRSSGMTLQAIAGALNQAGISGAHGGRWYPTSVRRVVGMVPSH